MPEMLSRIADSFFWMARYIERAEDTARILDVNYHMMLEQSQPDRSAALGPIDRHGRRGEALSPALRGGGARTVFEFLAFCPDNPSSVVQCISKARENARTIRDRISREMWEDINRSYHMVNEFTPRRGNRCRAASLLRRCEVRLPPLPWCDRRDAAPHEGWQFLRVGWSLERAEATARLVDAQYYSVLGAPGLALTPAHHQWLAVLRSVGAFEAYHRQYHAPILPEKVADMLILQPYHPRSIRFSSTEVQAGLKAISGNGSGSYANEAERLAGKVLESLRYDTIEEILSRGLHLYLADLVRSFRSIGEEIARTYFYYAVVA